MPRVSGEPLIITRIRVIKFFSSVPLALSRSAVDQAVKTRFKESDFIRLTLENLSYF